MHHRPHGKNFILKIYRNCICLVQIVFLVMHIFVVNFNIHLFILVSFIENADDDRITFFLLFSLSHEVFTAYEIIKKCVFSAVYLNLTESEITDFKSVLDPKTNNPTSLQVRIKLDLFC